jgi:hypothetical protein
MSMTDKVCSSFKIATKEEVMALLGPHLLP